jgi:small subunit ribosomal protein S3e
MNQGVEPRYMGISPIYAIPKLLEQVGLRKEDIDVYEAGAVYCPVCII